ncbi:MAG: hypothetical protein M5R40_22595 [Anaerolineae bacterium]|nr:hypothetical protein [Anaerolineae bacterium]
MWPISRRLFADPDFRPDELKIYPCSLIDGTELMDAYRAGRWRPYTFDELLAVLTECLALTPPYCRVSRGGGLRVSRMVRHPGALHRRWEHEVELPRDCTERGRGAGSRAQRDPVQGDTQRAGGPRRAPAGRGLVPDVGRRRGVPTVRDP